MNFGILLQYPTIIKLTTSVTAVLDIFKNPVVLTIGQIQVPVHHYDLSNGSKSPTIQ